MLATYNPVRFSSPVKRLAPQIVIELRSLQSVAAHHYNGGLQAVER